MRQLIVWGFFLLSFSSLSAMLVGNPAQPALFKYGLVTNPYSVSFRFGYLDDWVYKQRFKDEFKLEGVTHTRTFMKLSTYAGLLTVNIKKRFDLYGIVGSSRMQIDEEIFTKRALGWGIGGRLVLFKKGNFYCGVDGSYFQTNQKPRYFVVEGLPFNIVSKFRLKYRETQGALGIAYRFGPFTPYINGTYLHTKIEPEPPVLLVRLPDISEIVDVESKSILGQKRWGMALGATLVGCEKISLSFEWRAFNQNALNINGELRF